MKSLTTTIKIGLVVLVVAGLAMSGLALAQPGSDANVEPLDDTDRRAIAHLVALLAPLVDEGTITDAQAEAVAEHLAGEVDRRPVATDRARRLLAAVSDLQGVTPEEIVLQLDKGATLADIASAQGSSGEALAASLLQVFSDRIDARVADGMSEGRAGELLAAAERRINEYVFTSHDVPRRAVDAADRRADRRQARTDVRLAVLDLLGVTADELKAALPGTSLGAVAGSRGVTSEALIEVMVAPVAAALDEAVSERRLDQTAAAERLAAAIEHAEALVTAVHPEQD